jgi:seryl-tRNA synthetase
MIDINYLRQNPNNVKKAVKDKQLDPGIVDVALKLDEKWRETLQAAEKLRAEKNALSKDPSPEKIKKAKKVKQDLKKIEEDLKEVTRKYEEAIKNIPNPAAKDVEVGASEEENKVERTWGEVPEFEFKARDHLELGEMLDIIDVKKASKVSGARFAYLKNEAVLFEFALINLAMETLIAEGFTPVIPPHLIKKESMRGMGYLEHGGEADMFVLEKDDLVLIGTSEQSIGPMHMDETFEKKDLPKRYVGFSPCYRREAGSYGKDTRGIIRLHQFDKVEMFSYTLPEKADEEHAYLLELEEKLFQALEIPYRVTKMVTGDLGAPAARKYDIEAWIPSQKKYREVTSASTTTDFQARRLNIKYKVGDQLDFVHMLNGTAFAIGRTIVAILENYQKKDGSVEIPQVLRKWVGKDEISPKK